MTTAAEQNRISMERTWKAPLQDVWELWTTKAGLESWWGPEGFTVEVRKLDLRPGGQLLYAMHTTGAPQIAFMKQHGMPLTQELTCTYREVEPQRCLAYETIADFIPGTKPYPVLTRVELFPAAAGTVRMVLSFDRMHAPEWTQRAQMGWESELGKLQKALEAITH